MKVYLSHENLKYDIENLIAIFFKKSQLSFLGSENECELALSSGEPCLTVVLKDHIITGSYYEKNHLLDRFEMTLDKSHLNPGLSKGASQNSDQLNFNKLSSEEKRLIKRSLYLILEKYHVPMSKWGILVGIRPVKIVHECLDLGMSFESIEKHLLNDYLIHPEKVGLLMEIAQRERPHLYPIDLKTLSIYICIPFCPTRCLYCSFPSNDVRKKGKLMSPYIEKLIEEIRVTAEEIRKMDAYVDCIYIGGGTPTTLSENQLDLLLKGIRDNFDMSLIKEFTIEAGRPDSITDHKLKSIKEAGVDRICVNPQTMNDQTLVQIGRKHTADAIRTMFQKVRALNFSSINMDLIMGLPGESFEDAQRTIDEIITLKPENVTIHTLAVKRASRLNEHLEEIELAHDYTVADMMAYADEQLRQNDINPYYMYRQKKMIGHLENVGYATQGHESLYNMRIMEERHTIVALGAGAVSKICYPHENRFERMANFKGVEDYIDRFDQVVVRKRDAFDMLKNVNKK